MHGGDATISVGHLYLTAFVVGVLFGDVAVGVGNLGVEAAVVGGIVGNIVVILRGHTKQLVNPCLAVEDVVA